MLSFSNATECRKRAFTILPKSSGASSVDYPGEAWQNIPATEDYERAESLLQQQRDGRNLRALWCRPQAPAKTKMEGASWNPTKEHKQHQPSNPQPSALRFREARRGLSRAAAPHAFIGPARAQGLPRARLMLRPVRCTSRRSRTLLGAF
jgi:hypothetical protein